MDKKRDGIIIIITFLITISMTMIMIINPKSIYANISDSFVNNNIITNNGINNIFMINTTTATTFNNSNNSSETCKMPDCPRVILIRRTKLHYI